MQILKAYAGLGDGLPQPGLSQAPEERQERQERKAQDKGDTIHLSHEAREALAGRASSLSAQASDATYDQYGNVTRQFDSLQGELRSLAASLMSEGAGLAGQVGRMQTQLRSLRAMV